MVNKIRRLLFSLIALILFLGFLEVGFFLGLRLLKTIRQVEFAPISKNSIINMKTSVIHKMLASNNLYYQHSPKLGWTIKPNGSSGIYKANSLGIRSNREYSIVPSSDIIRVVSFGDSYTHCDQVKNSDTWQARIELSNQNYEVMNFGVSGFGPDQAYLRYQMEGIKYQPEIVLIGLMPENIHRIVNVFRPFYGEKTKIPLSKPRFIIESDTLKIIANPLPSLDDYRNLLEHPEEVLPVLGMYDYHYKTKYSRGPLDFLSTVKSYKMATSGLMANRPIRALDGRYNPDSKAFKLLCTIIHSFYQEVIQNGSTPVVILFPHSFDVTLKKSGKEYTYKPFLQYLDRNKIRYIDLFPIIKQGNPGLDISRLFHGHYTPYTNHMIGKGILQYLDRLRKDDSTNTSISSNFSEG